ncbi:uncharacterized protein LOC6556840 [Drosophila grimshawi]|uniref:GH15151 n=1 Tax=Drosophila grimshawi TaxID=7222 RepID=B4IY75_DROGR|nr:uncharacterized protein LOC6556840 [Drosophila grimshawi]EDV96525.1 GH15151 [Drosophila grimshawi]
MAALPDPSALGYNIARDPNLVKNRIFVGNLPTCTCEELESICHPYGKVLGSLVKKNFGFVQFENEEVANKCASALNKSTFKSNALTARNASIKAKAVNAKKLNSNAMHNPGVVPMSIQGGIVMSAADAATVVPINDCEIIVLNRLNTKYAEYIEDRLRKVGMRVDVLYPNEDVMLGHVLSNISARGCLYAVLVTPQHAALNSITIHILNGVQAEHRNMPREEAITLIATDFRLKKQRDAVTASQLHAKQGNRHPESMQQLIEMLASNRQLTGLQYECIIKYLEKQREQQLKLELGEFNELAMLQTPDPEIELQKKILDIMNKPAVTEFSCELMYPTFEAAKADKRLMEMLHDARVLKALASLYNSDLVDTVWQYL